MARVADRFAELTRIVKIFWRSRELLYPGDVSREVRSKMKVCYESYVTVERKIA